MGHAATESPMPDRDEQLTTGGGATLLRREGEALPANRKTRLVIISGFHQRWTHLEWVCQELCQRRFELSFILISMPSTEPHLAGFLAARGIPFISLHCKGRPRDIAPTLWRVYRYCRRRRPDVVHTHILLASLLGMVASFLARVPVRINTRHHVRLRQVVPDHGRVLSWLDRLTTLMATRTIATSAMLREVMVNDEGIPPGSIDLIHLGIDLEKFRQPDPSEVASLAERYLPGRGAPVIGVVARHIEWKGVQYIIPAFRRLLEMYPSAVLVLAGAYGPYHEALLRLLAPIAPERYVLIEFETNPCALYHLFDLVVHTPTGLREESFGLVYLEALAGGREGNFPPPGVAPELLVHRRNCWLVDHRNSEQIYDGMTALLANPDLRETLVREGLRTVDPAYSARLMQRSVEALYLESLSAARPDLFSRQRPLPHDLEQPVTTAIRAEDDQIHHDQHEVVVPAVGAVLAPEAGLPREGLLLDGAQHHQDEPARRQLTQDAAGHPERPQDFGSAQEQRKALTDP
jgi:glycosyltransferase involved in cell wall biosynthesis